MHDHIQHIWDILQTHLTDHPNHPNNLGNVQRFLLEIWKNLGHNEFRTQILSMNSIKFKNNKLNKYTKGVYVYFSRFQEILIIIIFYVYFHESVSHLLILHTLYRLYFIWFKERFVHIKGKNLIFFVLIIYIFNLFCFLSFVYIVKLLLSF